MGNVCKMPVVLNVNQETFASSVKTGITGSSAERIRESKTRHWFDKVKLNFYSFETLLSNPWSLSFKSYIFQFQREKAREKAFFTGYYVCVCVEGGGFHLAVRV